MEWTLHFVILRSFFFVFVLVRQPSVYPDCGFVVFCPGTHHHTVRCLVLWVWLRSVDASDTEYIYPSVQLWRHDVAKGL